MSDLPAIEVRNLSKVYRLYGNPYDRLIERLPWVKRPRHRKVAALRDLDFTVEPGQCVGIIGKNGAGKSTLLKILTGTTFPSAGSYSVRGRVASLLELGAGFHPDFTGRENIYMNAAMMGFSRKEAQRKVGEILEFSELGEFIDDPIRTYSSGMGARLGFSAAIAQDPDVLIIDEVLAVGDQSFQRKCVDKIYDFKHRGKTMFFCSHSLYDVRQICQRCIWLRDGRLQMLGDAVTVTNEYSTWESQRQQPTTPTGYAALPAAGNFDPASPPADDDHPRIVEAKLVDPATGIARATFSPGDDVAVRVTVRNSSRRERLAIAVGVLRSEGTNCFVHSSQFDNMVIDHAEFVMTLNLKQLRLLSGEYVVPVWLIDSEGIHRYHERPTEQNLVVQNRTRDLGLFLQEHEWHVQVLSAKVPR